MQHIVDLAYNPGLYLGLLLAIASLVLLKRRRAARSRRPNPVERPDPSAYSYACLPPHLVTPAPARQAAPARPDPSSPYERVPALLSAAERDFYAALRDAAPAGYEIFAQVSLAGLVRVKGWARRDKSHWWRIQAKRLDFVLVDAATLAPRLVVELDDASHDRADRRERDAFLDEVLAGVAIPILHVRWQRRYDPRALAEQLAAAMGLAMPTPQPVRQPAPPTTFVRSREPIPVAATPLVPAAPQAPVLPVAARVVDAPAVTMTIAPALAAPSRRVCGQCQAELSAGAKFCRQCGAMFGVG